MLNNNVLFDDSTGNMTEDDGMSMRRSKDTVAGNIMDQISKTILLESGEKYRNYSSKRRVEKDKTDHYRKGPAPIEESDAINKSTTKATYGTLDSDVEDLDFEEVRHQNSKNNYYNKLRLTTNEKGDNLASCRALIVYFSKLAKSKDEAEVIDLNFVESLLENGADINFPDKHGQTLLHEISRGWHPDVAKFAIEHGADINKCDVFGRTPLHLAAAVDYDDMVQYLVDNGGDLGAKTYGEEQTAMHYAAKNNAASSIKVMLRLGARINDRDYKRRTPLFVAAETARTDAARFLIDRGAPAGVYDSSGTSCLSLMIEKMPQIALEAVEQFHLLDLAFRKHYYYLSYLEPDPTYMIEYIPESKRERKDQSERKKAEKRLLKNAGQRTIKKEKSYAKTPLEVIVQYDQLDIIMHPVFQRLLHVKWNLFGKRGSAKMLALNFLYTLIWTVLGIMIPRDHQYYLPFKDNWWRLVLEVLGVSMTIYFIFMEISEVRNNEKKHNNWRQWRTRHMEKDLDYCHPRWPEERQYLSSELLQIRGYQRTYFRDPWNIFEWISYMVVLTLVLTRILSVASNNHTAAELHPKVYAIGLIVIWLRFMRSCRVFQTLGPFIAILGSVIIDTAKFSFLLFEFFVPYTVGFWIIFGGSDNASKMAKNDWESFNDLTFSVFSMTLMGSFDWNGLVAVDRLMAQILCGTYFALAGVVCMNLYIALLSDTFARVYAQAKATAVMQQAKTVITLEGKLSKFYRSKYAHFFLRECSPQEVYTREESHDDDERESEKLERISRHIVNRIDSMEENMLFQHKKLQTYHNIPIRGREDDDLDNVEDGNDDGFGGSGSLGGSGSGGGSGGAGCKALMARVMEIQKNQYSDVKKEMDRIKSMLNNIYTLLQDDDEEDEPQPPPLQTDHQTRDHPDTSKAWKRVLGPVNSPSFSEGIPLRETPLRRGSVPSSPTEISSLLKNIQALVETSEQKIPADKSRHTNFDNRQQAGDDHEYPPPVDHPYQLSPPSRRSSNQMSATHPNNRENSFPVHQKQQQQQQQQFHPPSTAYPMFSPKQNFSQGGSLFPPSIGNLKEMTHLSSSLPPQPTTNPLYPALNHMGRKVSTIDMSERLASKTRQQSQGHLPSTQTPSQLQFSNNTSVSNFSVGSEASSTTTLNNADISYSDLNKTTTSQQQDSAPNTGGRRRRRKKKSSTTSDGIPMNYTETM